MSESSKEDQAMANNAQALMQESQKMLQQVMAECSVEAFQSVPLNIPQAITEKAGVVNLTDQEQVWQHINQLYESQASLYGEPAVEVAGAVTPEKNQANDSNEQLGDINKMLGM